MDETYIKESCKTYQKCQVANSARRNSLMKKTIGIEAQRKLASHQMDREERQLREQLKHMRVEQAKCAISNGVRERSNSQSKGSNSKQPRPLESRDSECIDPYPVTFGRKLLVPGPVQRQRSMTMVDKAGQRYLARRGRRESKEFEDLSVNTSTGTLAIPSHLLLHAGTRSPTSSGTPSPSTPRRPLNGSHSSLDSNDGSHWPGDPEAIHSVRRPRKSVEQQDKERMMRLKGDLSPHRNSIKQ